MSDNSELERLRQGLARVTMFIGTLPATTVTVKVDGTITSVSQSFANLTGYSPGTDIHLKNKPINEILLSELDNPKLAQFLSEDCRGKICRASLRSHDGSPIPVWFTMNYFDIDTLILCIIDARQEVIELKSE